MLNTISSSQSLSGFSPYPLSSDAYNLVSLKYLQQAIL